MLANVCQVSEGSPLSPGVKQVLMVIMAQVRMRPSKYRLISSILPTALAWQGGPMSQQWEMTGM